MKKFLTTILATLVCFSSLIVEACNSGSANKGSNSTSDTGNAEIVLDTVEDILFEAISLKNNQSLPVEVELEGTVSAIVNAYNPQEKYITITMSVENIEIDAYHLKGEGAELLAKWYTVKVKGIISNKNGTLQFDEGCQIISYQKGENPNKNTNGFVAEDLGLSNTAAFSSYTAGDITFTAQKNNGTTPCYRDSGKALRFYQGNTFTIATTANHKIVSITIKVSQFYIDTSNCTITNGTATGLGTTDVTITPIDGTKAIILTGLAEFRIAEIIVDYETV